MASDFDPEILWCRQCCLQEAERGFFRTCFGEGGNDGSDTGIPGSPDEARGTDGIAGWVFGLVILTGRPIAEMVNLSVPQLRALERAAIRVRAADRLQEMAVMGATLAAVFGSQKSEAEDLGRKLSEMALTGRCENA